MTILKKQGVAWAITAVMIVAAIAIGLYRGGVLTGSFPSPPKPPHAPSAPDFPGNSTVTMYIQDDANVLSDATETMLADRNSRLLNRYDAAIAVVTCNYGRDNLYDYALKRGKEMGVTDSYFIVVLDISGDNYYLIGIEGYFTDEDCSDYTWNYMEDAFAAGDYDRAVLDLTEMLELWYDTNFG